jgi:hypothetical protein
VELFAGAFRASPNVQQSVNARPINRAIAPSFSGERPARFPKEYVLRDFETYTLPLRYQPGANRELAHAAPDH